MSTDADSIVVTRARIADVPAIVVIVERFAKRGEILPRTSEEVYQSVREWVVAKRGDEVVGCGSLVVLWADLAEIRSLIVNPELQGMGVGRRIVTMLLEQAAELEIPRVFALTRKPGFFAKLGFYQVPRESLPRKIWKDCIHCLKFVGCDEVALVQDIDLTPVLDMRYGIQASVPTKTSGS